MATSVKKIALPSMSMFTQTPVYNIGGTIAFGLMQPTVLPDVTDQIYVVSQGLENRLDKISYLFYRTSRLWWAIAQLNNLVDPMLDIPTGTQLRIPTKDRLPS